MEQEEVRKGKKRRTKQLYFGKRDNRLWDYVQSLPEGEGNALIMEILTYHIFGGIKPDVPVIKGMNDTRVEVQKVGEVEEEQRTKVDETPNIELLDGLIR